MRPSRLLARLRSGQYRNVGFGDARRLLQALGFELVRVRGSHCIYSHPHVPELVNMQEVRGEAKAYQLRQVLSLVEEYNLGLEGEMMHKYHINIFFSEEDGGYVADVPDLRHCSAFGETAEKALAEVERAMVLWLEAAKASGRSVPEPAYKPEIYQKA